MELDDSAGLLVTDPPIGGSDEMTAIIDGGEPIVFTLSESDTTYHLASGLEPGNHRVEIYKRTETEMGTVAYVGFTEPLVPTPSPFVHRIEFIGDSITCGYGIDTTADSSSCKLAVAENSYASHASITGRFFHASNALVSWSGRGLATNWDSSTTNLMPDLYPRTLGDDASTAWDFASWTPDVVVVNLGANDSTAAYNAGPPLGQPFADAYLAFLQVVRGHYPDAYIVAALGPTITDPNLTSERTLIKAAVTKSADSKISFIEYPRQTTYACNGHPTAATQAAMAVALEAVISALTGW